MNELYFMKPIMLSYENMSYIIQLIPMERIYSLLVGVDSSRVKEDLPRQDERVRSCIDLLGVLHHLRGEPVLLLRITDPSSHVMHTIKFTSFVVHN